MTTQHDRARSGFATVYLTLASVVIALALEKLSDRMVAVAPFPPIDAAGALTWLQGGIVLVVAFTMFIIVSYVVLALRWDFGLLDAAAPFVLIIILAAVIAAIGLGAEPAFFYVAAVGQGTGGLALLQILREAAQDPVNDEILAESDYTATFVLGTTASVLPLIVAVLLHTGRLDVLGAAVGATLMLACLLALLWSFSRSWSITMGQRSRGAARAVESS